MQKADVLKQASLANIKALRERTPMIQVVPSAKLASTLATVLPGNPLPPPAPPGKAHKSMGSLSGVAGVVPSLREATSVTARDTEHKLAKKEDGTLEIRRG
jgi:hypothetical protein